ncbi:N-acetyl-1-D-myo-inositol-2-amino-2-deoxy-alpha-D-glucopyranoside deacetylase [uncultured Jatrophihabitans sp.]|uniref:N-acetyl-1-D-myo-inositol-2-amino-2-deoxy-alpha- D-glucopyranoside deacetylase n=1 Tax=uncultured Jatrophihabitans sp. TaxID=1610747 RepID=UPI0035CC7A60
MSPRLLFVHAHPDDESITTGAAMAHYARRGVEVTLLTCTLGEEGEILVPELAALVAGQADQLGGYRIGELSAAMRALGVSDHRFLGGAGRFRDSGMGDARDSGMLGSPSNDHPRAFWRAAKDDKIFAEAVQAAADVIREVRPDAVVSYDPAGGYGHPDHVMAHRVTMAAVAAVPVPRVFWTVDPDSVLDRDVAAVAAAAGVPFTADRAQLHFGVPDAVVTTVVDAGDALAAKRAALEAHATQLTVWGEFYALSNGIGRTVSGTEYFRAAPGYPAPADDLLGDG